MNNVTRQCHIISFVDRGIGAAAPLLILKRNRSTKYDVLVMVHNFVVLRENVQKNEKSVHM